MFQYLSIPSNLKHTDASSIVILTCLHDNEQSNSDLPKVKIRAKQPPEFKDNCWVAWDRNARLKAKRGLNDGLPSADKDRQLVRSLEHLKPEVQRRLHLSGAVKQAKATYPPEFTESFWQSLNRDQKRNIKKKLHREFEGVLLGTQLGKFSQHFTVHFRNFATGYIKWVNNHAEGDESQWSQAMAADAMDDVLEDTKGLTNAVRDHETKEHDGQPDDLIDDDLEDKMSLADFIVDDDPAEIDSSQDDNMEKDSESSDGLADVDMDDETDEGDSAAIFVDDSDVDSHDDLSDCSEKLVLTNAEAHSEHNNPGQSRRPNRNTKPKPGSLVLDTADWILDLQ